MSLTATMDAQMGNAPPGPQHSQSVSLGSSAVQQPKVQTAFIHKLYNMLEDANIQHLISWSPSNESFVVSPTGEFSKVLSQYFKHTNISSFVRQLNMYGFHKVNDVFHTGSPDSTLWEFKHGNGSFKRGDLVGLREIKRRASRHALIHRDSFSGPKGTAVSAPGTPGEQSTDSVEARLSGIEQTLFDVTTRLARTEDNNTYLSARCQAAVDGFSRCRRYTSEIAQFLSHAFPSDAPILRDIQSLQKEIERHSHALEEPPREMMHRDAPTFTTTLVDNGVPLSPRQRPVEDDSLRGSFSGPPRPYFRHPAPPAPQAPGRRLAAPGMAGSSSPNSLRPQRDHQQPIPHPLSNLQSQSPPGHLSRRHTTADIRQHGWQVNSPFSGIGQTPHWPPSPGKPPNDYRDAGPYDMSQAPRPSIFSSQTTPPLNEGGMGNHDGPGGGIAWGFGGTKFPPPREAGHTAPPTRRSSLASSSVHALLNPPDSAMDRDGVSDGEPDDRKRKRMM
ncbi:HSF-type DNA-binding-domain-containing protein [Tricharina praecox]|uniref:HSF-type DNA-binding-domain-containing protein n=1 Tax=Tricharina praecox TaxID=43433 RepID=UPI00221FEE9C|nr:HSF-type DNA-binding-domain-containing protein [Tricharina praecox]KAI5848172.1 HSF-type DNA-binding-domain-containing protein [Tricharina praecox]